MVAMPTVPWWAYAGISLILVEYPPDLSVFGGGGGARSIVAPGALRKDKDPVGEPVGRRATDAEGVKLDFKIPDINISIPCLGMAALGMKFIDPCGNVSIGADGKDIHTPFGTEHIPGTALLQQAVERGEKQFEHYTAYFVGGLTTLYAALTALIPSRRIAAMQSIKDIFAGKIEKEDPTATEEDKEADRLDKLDPKSENFIAPGNIYRLLAVLHPGKVGFHQWSKWAAKAGVCGYMQIYLPWKIVCNVLAEWSINGIKSPLWFVAEGTAFLTMFASLGSLCSLFAGKCAEAIRVGAEANFYILTHCEDPAMQATENAPTEDGGGWSFLPGAGAPVPPVIVKVNEYFWCCFSMTMNVAMSLLLFLAMFLKVATFTGKIGDIAIVAVSLYFIFDLDDKVMASDPQLKPKYRRSVLKQTVERDYKPVWLLALASGCKAFMGFLTPIGLAMIILISWKSGTTVIGGADI